eukprot:3794502-Rhodomonas_salina.3
MSCPSLSDAIDLWQSLRVLLRCGNGFCFLDLAMHTVPTPVVCMKWLQEEEKKEQAHRIGAM